MHISRLELNNIRCFEQARLDCSPRINLLVGENNSGKSTLIRCFSILQQSFVNHTWVRYGASEATVSAIISEIAVDRLSEPTRGHIASRGGTGGTIEVKNRILVGGSSTSQYALAGAALNFAPFPNTQPANLIESYLSERSTSGLTEQVNSTNTFAVGGNRAQLVSKIDHCFGSAEIQDEYRQACKQVLGFVVTTWSSPNGKMAGLELSARQQKYIRLDQMGAGVAQAVGLIVDLLMTELKLFLIEELENDLHPTALRALLSLVERSLERRNQFVISTHSSVVLRALGSRTDTQIFHVDRMGEVLPPKSNVALVPTSGAARRELLKALGYELMDYDLYSGWLILEESSAECIVREFLIPWFAPRLIGRIRTVAAMGASDVAPRFIDLHRLFTFIHLEPAYRESAWVLVDGDEAGKAAIAALRTKFVDWPQERFSTFDQPSFEYYYPKGFREHVLVVLNISDRHKRQVAKSQLRERVVAWIRSNEADAKIELAESAADVIKQLRDIEKTISQQDGR